MLSIVAGINELKTQQSMYHANVNVKLMVENVIQIKSAITLNVSASRKFQNNILLAKNIIFRRMLNVFVKMVNI